MKLRILFTVMLILVLTSGCSFVSDCPYEFRQDFDQIKKIEIVKKEYDSIRTDTPIQLIKVLDESEHQAMIDAILDADGSYVGLEPGTGFGLYIIRIYYQNGEIELLGQYNNGYISPDGEIHQDIYAFDREDFNAIISEFLDDEITGYP